MSIYDIRNERDLRDAYWFLSVEKELGCSAGKIAKKIKTAIREWNHRPESDRKVVYTYGGCGDSVIYKINCPVWVENEEDAEYWFDNEERMTYRWSPYDCTGQLFTSWHRIFHINGKWICYHSVSCDV